MQIYSKKSKKDNPIKKNSSIIIKCKLKQLPKTKIYLYLQLNESSIKLRKAYQTKRQHFFKLIQFFCIY